MGEQKRTAILISGGRITRTSAKRIADYMTKMAEGDDVPDEAILIELPVGATYKVVDFDVDKVISEMNIVEAE